MFGQLIFICEVIMMKDKDKTKEQLAKELQSLRHRIVKLEKSRPSVGQ